MNATRESISVALFSLFSNSAALSTICKTITRSPKIWTEVSPAQMPWLQLFKGGPDTESFSQVQAIGLTKYVIHYNLWFYMLADPTGMIIAETVINNASDAIDAAMQAGRKGERQTLGGLVTNAWIDGGSEWGREMEDENIVVGWRISVETGI